MYHMASQDGTDNNEAEAIGTDADAEAAAAGTANGDADAAATAAVGVATSIAPSTTTTTTTTTSTTGAAAASSRWSREEDDQLRKGVEALGPRDWKRISEDFLGGKRKDIQCYQRWERTLKVCKKLMMAHF